ncbi:MAG: [ribosomal protein S18]-alanine N-acetyltransferase [Alphaproteobacteria bacterium]|jgi:ribosomal-protein-alanine N-acetyltransferase|nr:[ribosomal protein S18]-alanine N-acetyltransferase [Alphaproteobacteria bacterium]
MMNIIARLFARGEPALSEARAQDAAAIASIHAASFNRGWSEEEIEYLMLERNVLTHRAMVGADLVGFIMSRHVAGEGEILSIAVASHRRKKGLARRLLDVHMRRLAGLGVRTIFLEVNEGNAPARKLYQRAGFREAGRRAGYYRDPAGKDSTALVLRCDLP